jgi:1-acyl-sn-glycerol-3-phosphate acyltransferase
MIFRNFLFYLGLVPVTVFFALLSPITFFLPFHLRYFIITRWSCFFIAWAKWTCDLNYNVQNQENIPKQTCIVFSNHQSMWETIFMQVLFPNQAWVLKKELLQMPFFGWGLSLLKPIAIDRKNINSVKQLIEQGKQCLQENRWVIIFPEGTRVFPGVEHRYSRSGAALAEATRYPVLCVAHNAGLFWPKGFWIKKSGTVQVVIGFLIDSKDKTTAEIQKLTEQWMRERVAANCFPPLNEGEQTENKSHL